MSRSFHGTLVPRRGCRIASRPFTDRTRSGCPREPCRRAQASPVPSDGRAGRPGLSCVVRIAGTRLLSARCPTAQPWEGAPGRAVAAGPERCPPMVGSWVGPNLFPGNRGRRSQIWVWQDKRLLSSKLEASPVTNFAFLESFWGFQETGGLKGWGQAHELARAPWGCAAACRLGTLPLPAGTAGRAPPQGLGPLRRRHFLLLLASFGLPWPTGTPGARRGGSTPRGR